MTIRLKSQHWALIIGYLHPHEMNTAGTVVLSVHGFTGLWDQNVIEQIEINFKSPYQVLKHLQQMPC